MTVAVYADAVVAQGRPCGEGAWSWPLPAPADASGRKASPYQRGLVCTQHIIPCHVSCGHHCVCVSTCTVNKASTRILSHVLWSPQCETPHHSTTQPATCVEVTSVCQCVCNTSICNTACHRDCDHHCLCVYAKHHFIKLIQYTKVTNVCQFLCNTPLYYTTVHMDCANR